jgi:hypothetical protein
MTETPEGLNAAVLNRDYTVIVDYSGSMGNPVGNGDKRSKWDAVGETAVAVARKLNEFDPDGITVYTFSNAFNRYDNQGPEKVEEIFKKGDPNGSTALHLVLHHAFENYFSRRDAGKAQPNGESLFVFTDGSPDDQQAVIKEIVAATKKVNHAKELSLTLIQVGDDAGAQDFLHKLDDELTPAGAKYDIVDTISASKLGGRSLTDVITQAITEHKQAS